MCKIIIVHCNFEQYMHVIGEQSKYLLLKATIKLKNQINVAFVNVVIHDSQ